MELPMSAIARVILFLISGLFLCASLAAQPPREQISDFIRMNAPVIVLKNVRVIDGTGAVARDRQTIVISGGKIQSVAASATPPPNAQVLDLDGYTVIPGLVGMHDHMFFPMAGNPPIYGEMGVSF